MVARGTDTRRVPQVDGFPPPEELKTVYVEHDLDDSEVEMTVVEYLTGWFAEKEPGMGVTRDVVLAQLNEVRARRGFFFFSFCHVGVQIVASFGETRPVVGGQPLGLRGAAARRSARLGRAPVGGGGRSRRF